MSSPSKAEITLNYYFSTFPILPEIKARITSITQSVCSQISSKKLPFSDVLHNYPLIVI